MAADVCAAARRERRPNLFHLLHLVLNGAIFKLSAEIDVFHCGLEGLASPIARGAFRCKCRLSAAIDKSFVELLIAVTLNYVSVSHAVSYLMSCG